MNFADRLKYYRTEKEISQRELSERMHISQGTISSWETGRTEPTIEQVAEMCRIFGCSMAALTGTRERNSDELTTQEVMIRISSMELDDLNEIQKVITDRIEELQKRKQLEVERVKLKKELKALQKRLGSIEVDIRSINGGIPRGDS